MPHLAADRLRQMPLAAHILHQDDFAGADLPRFPVARGDLHPAVQVDDVLPPRCGMPAKIVIAPSLPENNAVRRQPRRQLAAVAFLNPFDLDVAPVGLTRIVNVKIMDTPRSTPPVYSIGTKIECRI